MADMTFRLTRYDRSIGLGLNGQPDYMTICFIDIKEMRAYFGIICKMFNLIAHSSAGGFVDDDRRYTSIWFEL
jgi:hypothetical protein